MRRRNRKQEPIAISEAELVAMTRRPRRRAPRDAAVDAREPRRVERVATTTSDAGITHLVSTPSSRRAFLLGGGAVLGGVALVGSGVGSGLAAAATRTRRIGVPAAASAQKLTGDLAVVALAASLENLAVGTYQAGIDAATKGKLGAVPPAVVTFAQTAQSQHKDHAAAWNGVLTGAGKKAVTGVDLTVKKSVDKAFAEVKDVPGLAKLALDLENVAAATYLAAIDVVKNPAGIKTAATHPAGRDAARGDPELPARPVPGARLLRQERPAPAPASDKIG